MSHRVEAVHPEFLRILHASETLDCHFEKCLARLKWMCLNAAGWQRPQTTVYRFEASHSFHCSKYLLVNWAGASMPKSSQPPALTINDCLRRSILLFRHGRANLDRLLLPMPTSMSTPLRTSMSTSMPTPLLTPMSTYAPIRMPTAMSAHLSTHVSACMPTSMFMPICTSTAMSTSLFCARASTIHASMSTSIPTSM